MNPARARLGPKPWRPYPRQLEALVTGAQGAPLSEIADRMGIKPPAVSSLLSDCYKRLGITRENTPGHHLSHVRREEAIKVCKEHGWWPEDGRTIDLGPPPVWGVLTPDDVRKIRSAPRTYGSRARLAKQFGVSIHTISTVRSGNTWKNVN